MHFNKPSCLAKLLRIIRTVTSDLTLGDDLYQEAMIHLWLTEKRRPGQTESWYLKSCKFRLRHYLASGRSVDSRKRRIGQLNCEIGVYGADEFPAPVDPGDPVFGLVSTRDLMSVLSCHLLPVEKAVLGYLADGLGVREIGRRMDISHTMVRRHRTAIARLLLDLETPSLVRLPSLRENGLNGLKGTNHVKGTKARTRFYVNGTNMRTRFDRANYHTRSSAFCFRVGSK
jgi:DNA-directed RNA polymerase specialized sigma24 family protein